MKILTAPLILSLSLAGSSLSHANMQAAVVPSLSKVPSHQDAYPYDVFVPIPTLTTRLDFSAWDDLLKEMVYYTGPSLRQRAPHPQPLIATNIVYGHTSPYRLEGNRVVFETFNDEFEALLDQYVSDLVAVGERVNIRSLPRDEQLSYWLNLHNALVIQAIADNYPIMKPSELRGQDGLDFHNSKRVTLNGVPLSLRNIREDIVYRNWDDPMVIYGFFHGDIGSPSIQRKAYTAATVKKTLAFSADEFVNSLRAFMAYGDRAVISRHYKDAAHFFFPAGESDIRAHMASLMNDDVREQLEEATDPIRYARYETAVADLTKGSKGRGEYINRETEGFLGQLYQTPPLLRRSIEEHADKMERVRRRGLFGDVSIEDIETVDPDLIDDDE